MTATGIRPQIGAVVFIFGSLLDKQFTGRIENKYGKSSVQNPRLVGFYFFHSA
jgi:hypothetical protein